MAKERPAAPPPASVTGVTVPHHLLAADLIARGIWAASSGRYERVVIVGPDHFRALSRPFGVTTVGLDTAMGIGRLDPAFSAALLREDKLFEDVGGATSEHAIHSVAPFVRAVFPEARIVGVMTSSSATAADWEAAVALLVGLVGPETLVVQSTDYSHHLRVETAVLRDQESVSAISEDDPEAAKRLVQPIHLDSAASQFLQMALQRRRFGARPVVVANRSSAEYAPTGGGTTSYIVTVYLADPAHGARFVYPDQTVVYFAGDTLIGRGFERLLDVSDSAAAAIEREVKARTNGGPLVVNLEGPILDDRPAVSDAYQHVAPARLAIPLLKRMNVVAASLANNHSHDFGEEGLRETRRYLAEAGIAALEHGVVHDLGELRLLPLTFKRGLPVDHEAIRSEAQLERYCDAGARSPLVALTHWGEEYTTEPGAWEQRAADVLARCGVSAVLGSHSHAASRRVRVANGGATPWLFSTGNFIFDQRRPDVSGAIVELRIFRQGTVALRAIELPNLFEKASAAGR